MKAAIYARKSVQTEKGESIDNQIHLCREYGSRLHIEDFIIYSDEGFSGGNIKRPKFKEMMADAKNKKFDVLICYRLDRISRNVADFSSTLELLQKNNIEFISIKEQFDTSSPIGRAMVYISSVFAQLERETIAERIKDNMLELAKTGRWLGGTAPLGFRSEAVEYTDSNGKHKKMFKLVEIPEEIEVVQLIFQLYFSKKSSHSVANYLCRNHFKGKKGGEFSRNTVEQIIKNPVYAIADENIYNYFSSLGATLCGNFYGTKGVMTYNKKAKGKNENPVEEWIVAVGSHQGIITSDIWIKCQEIINASSLKLPTRSGTGSKFLLSGLLICGVCGSPMSSWSRNNPKRRVLERYYRCNLKSRAANRCTSTMLNANVAEEAVLSNIKALSIEKVIENYNELQKDFNIEESLRHKIKKLQNDIDENNKIIRNLIRKLALLEDDPTVISEVQLEIRRLKEDNLKYEETLNELNISKNNLLDKDTFIKEVQESLKSFKTTIEMEKNLEKRKEYLASFIDTIIWDSDNQTLIVNIIGSEPYEGTAPIRKRNYHPKTVDDNLFLCRGCR